MPVALSTSASDDVETFGHTATELAAARRLLAHRLLTAGAQLVFGGHFGEGGITRELLELVDGSSEPIWTWVGWPCPLPDEHRLGYGDVATIERIERPVDIDEHLHPTLVAEPEGHLAVDSAWTRYAWARGMTAMREAQVQATTARVAIGGRTGGAGAWYVGRMPGVVEEIALAVRAGQPVFLIGGFGGAARLVADLVEAPTTDVPERLTWRYQRQAPYSDELRDLYEQRGDDWWEYEEIIETLRAGGPEGVNPLLSVEQNVELWHTADPERIVELVTEGLRRLG